MPSKWNPRSAVVSVEHSHGLQLLQTTNFVKPRSGFLSTVARRFTSPISEGTRRDSKTTGCGPKFQPRCHKPKVVTHCTHHHLPQGINPYGLMDKNKVTGRETIRMSTRMDVTESRQDSTVWSLPLVTAGRFQALLWPRLAGWSSSCLESKASAQTHHAQP